MFSLDLDNDEERDFYRWEHIEGSEDYIFLEERGHNYQEDDYETGEYSKVVTYLQKISPHIRWRVTWDGTDSYGAHPSQWRIICVPGSQLFEAQYIFDRLLKGEDLSSYSYTDRYPEIYYRDHNNEPALDKEISELYSLLSDFEDCLFNWRKKAEQPTQTSLFDRMQLEEKNGEKDVMAFFEKLSDILPQIYFHAKSLPYILGTPDLPDQGTMGFERNISLSEYDEFSFFPDPYKKQSETLLLSELLLRIYEDVEQGLIAFSTQDPDSIAGAVTDWRIGFSIQNGWGREVLMALYVINEVIRKIRA